MQGRYIEHQALKALGGRERISMVTFLPKSPLIKDETVLVGLRGISDLSQLYTQYTKYRLEILEERIRHMLKKEREREITKRPFDVQDVNVRTQISCHASGTLFAFIHCIWFVLFVSHCRYFFFAKVCNCSFLSHA
jgi:hypothetical protein